MDHSPRFRWAALLLIALVTAGRLAMLCWCCPLDLAPDEAHYWDWSRQLDWCYYSKGPLVAWLIRLSCELFGDDMPAVRLPAVVCGSLLLAGLYVFTVQVHRSDKRAFLVVALALTLPIVAAGSTLMTIDAPFNCCWMWALVFAYQALFRPARWAWPLAGTCVLLGVLAKHAMLLWPASFLLFLGATPAMRGQLRRPGVWVVLGLGMLGGVPLLAWNVAHDGVTLRHTLGWHAGLDSERMIHWLGPLHYLSVQCAVLLGLWFLLWALAVWRHRPAREKRPELCFLWWMSVPTFVFFGLFSWKNGGGEANWPLPSYLAGMVLAVNGLGVLSSVRGFVVASFALFGLLLQVLFLAPLQMQPVLLQITGPATTQHPAPIRRVDPTSRLRGWRYLAEEVDQIRKELAGRGIDPVLAAERWTMTAELRYYCQEHPTVYCLGLLVNDRHSQYDLWRPNPVLDADQFQGRTFLLVGIDTEALARHFDVAEPSRLIEYRENGELVQQWMIAIAHGYRGREWLGRKQY